MLPFAFKKPVKAVVQAMQSGWSVTVVAALGITVLQAFLRASAELQPQDMSVRCFAL